ncbi:MAG TPA: hypothetical protein VFR33_10130 [Candidatus Dormibacteraeota bacterium]|nr:hypothetical protein [Candidatus Dormibacteraeota bacterium]
MITPIGRIDARRAFVRRTVIRSVLAMTLTAIGAGIGLAIFADHAGVVFRAAFAVAGFLIALAVLTNFTEYVYGDRDAMSRRRQQRAMVESWPVELLEIEGRVSMARVSAFDYQSRLRPLLRDLTRQRLEANRHFDIEAQAGEARAVIGDELWEQVRPMPLLRDLRERPGPTTAAITRMVDQIESI